MSDKKKSTLLFSAYIIIALLLVYIIFARLNIFPIIKEKQIYVTTEVYVVRRADDYDEGYDSGYDSGSDDGYDRGYYDGHVAGFYSGYDIGYNDALAGREYCEDQGEAYDY